MLTTVHVFVLFTLSISTISCVPPRAPDNLQNDINSVKSSLKSLSREIELLRSLYLDNLEPKVSKAVSSLVGIDNNINHLNIKSHVWDTFQHYISSWNDQISTIDRKMDIINEGQFRFANLESRLETLTNSDIDFKLTNIESKLSDFQQSLDSLNSKVDYPKELSLFSEFATRGILTTLKNIERKVEREDSKCSKDLRNDLLSDVASKVDLIFDKLAKDIDDSGEEEGESKRKDSKKILEGVLKNIDELDARTEMVISGQKEIKKMIQTEYIESYFSQQRIYIEQLFKEFSVCSSNNATEEYLKPKIELCDDLFAENKNKPCEVRNEKVWTVIQRRDLYPVQQNFNLTWENYKQGFGNSSESFWIGNENLNRFGKLALRIELEDFAGNSAWAEYKHFEVAAESDDFRLTVGGYTGNATDSFSHIHNGSLFSTFDRKNDLAPDCCPCAVAYGGGWWYNSCFESNLNGIYYENSQRNDEYYRGIIWEKWLGNYSLKKSLMMVRTFEEEHSAENEDIQETTSEIQTKRRDFWDALLKVEDP